MQALWSETGMLFDFVCAVIVCFDNNVEKFIKANLTDNL